MTGRINERDMHMKRRGGLREKVAALVSPLTSARDLTHKDDVTPGKPDPVPRHIGADKR